MKDRITMTHVARRAGVHPTTVSLALRNHPSIPPSTRERIRTIADEMGYRPDPALNALTAYRHAKLARRETPPLAYLTHWDSEWGWRKLRAHERFFAGAVAEAEASGYKLEHFWLGEPGLSQQRISDILVARGITGVIVSSHLPENDRPLALDWRKLSAVKIGCLPHAPQLHHVTNDCRSIMQLAVQRIRAAGYRRIGMVLPRWLDECTNLAWSAGFLAEQQRLEPEERIPVLHTYGDLVGASVEAPCSPIVAAKPFAEWLKLHRPEVLLAKAQLVQPQLEQLGLSVPGDIALAEIDLDPDSEMAGVRHNCERVGALAVDLLVRQMHQNRYGVPEYMIASLVEGAWQDGPTLPVREPHGSSLASGQLLGAA